LTANIESQRNPCEVFDLFTLAVCRQGLGDPAGAREAFDRAVSLQSGANQWTTNRLAEISLMKAEASQKLGSMNATSPAIPGLRP
jgi:hypothetical protein